MKEEKEEEKKKSVREKAFLVSEGGSRLLVGDNDIKTSKQKSCEIDIKRE